MKEENLGEFQRKECNRNSCSTLAILFFIIKIDENKSSKKKMFYQFFENLSDP